MDWDLTDEDALPEGSTLSGNKVLMYQYPEDEANSEQPKKTNTGKGKRGNPKNKKRRRTKDDGRPMRGQPLDQL